MNEDAVLKQMELLDKKMSETSGTANEHLTKFLFGGLIATIALLNTDLLLIRDYESGFQRLFGSAVVSIVALVLAHRYFLMVLRQYNDYVRSHRKLKYKYELTLHKLLSAGTDEEYQRYLERNPEPKGGPALAFPADKGFGNVAEYLMDHHGRRLAEIKDKSPRFFMAMDIVYLTLAVKLVSLLLNYGFEAFKSL